MSCRGCRLEFPVVGEGREGLRGEEGVSVEGKAALGGMEAAEARVGE